MFFFFHRIPPAPLRRGPVTGLGKSLGRPSLQGQKPPTRSGRAGRAAPRGEAAFAPSAPQAPFPSAGREARPGGGAAQHGTVRGPAGRRRLRPVLRHD